jgi:hypothetical protein
MNKLQLLMVLLRIIFGTFFQHEWEAQHFDQQVMAYLNQHYRNQGIGHADPNIGHLDFQINVWSLMKEMVFKIKVKVRVELLC